MNLLMILVSLASLLHANDVQDKNGCHLPNECFWQTCRYTTDYEYWTVNCRPQPDSPDYDCQIYHGHNLLNGNNQADCNVCWNLQCGQKCINVWEDPECNALLTDVAHIDRCPQHPTYGGQCQDPSETHCYLPYFYYPDAAVKGYFQCPTADPEKGIVHLGETCAYVCFNGVFAGTVTCATRTDGEGIFDESFYNPQYCN